MTEGPLVSVVTVSYNSLQGLRETNESLRRCRAAGWETLVIDGSSTDGTAPFLKSEECVYDVRVCEKDSGIYDAMNKGVQLSRGRYVLFMNCGDRLHESLDLDALAVALSGPLSVAVGQCLTDKGHLITFSPKAFQASTFVKMALPHQSSFIPREFFTLYGPYDLSYRLAADQEWFLRVLQTGAPFSLLPLLVARYQGGGLSEAPRNQKLVKTERRRLLVQHRGWVWFGAMTLVRIWELDEWTKKIANRLRKAK